MSVLRWLRVTRFYRSVPDFDRCTDERCETLVVQARLRRGDAIWLVPGGLAVLLGLVLAGFGHMVVTLILAVVTGSAAPGAAAGPGGNAPTQAEALATVLQLMNLSVALGAMIVVFVAVRRVMLIRSMRRILNKAVCPFCEFSLVGLLVSSGRVQCPECGERFLLSDHRLTEEDLIPDTPEGLRAMREHWKKLGADRYGALSGGRPEQAGPKGAHAGGWSRRDPARKPDRPGRS